MGLRDVWTVKPMGERAVLARWHGDGARVPRSARGAPAAGVAEVVPTVGSLAVYFDPAVLDHTGAARVALRLARTPAEDGGRFVRIPVLYGGEAGPDLDDVAALTGLTAAEVVRLHAAEDYTVQFLGFVPGFAYLGFVAERLRVPRLAVPRTRVETGSVGLADEFTGVYPRPTPGGWRLLGRTPLALYRPDRGSLLRPGDRVSFQPVGEAEFARVEARQAAALAAARAEAAPAAEPAAAAPGMLVVRPGPLATVQDMGRPGHQAAGVPVAGAADRQSLWVANRLVGNEAGAAALEVTLMGFEAEALIDLAVAVGGPALGAEVDGRPVPPGQSVLLRRGARLRIGGGPAGLRAYVAVSGGIAVPPVLGSRSTDLLGGLGGFQGRALRAGDVLPVGRPAAPPGDLAGRRAAAEVLVPCPETVMLRCVPGPEDDAFSAGAAAFFFSGEFAVDQRSDRQGLRLQGPAVPPDRSRLPSAPTCEGAVQVPPAGGPVLLLAGCQTTGGYPRLATVIGPDVPLAAQARPGRTRLRFRAVTAEEGRLAWLAWRAFLAGEAWLAS